MSDQHKETLSALFDGETSEFETRRLLTELDDNARLQWQRYQFIRDAAHNAVSETHLSIDISANVAAQIANETIEKPVTNKQQLSKETWFKSIIGFAAAASIAFVTVLGVQNLQLVNQPLSAGFVANGNVSASQLPMASNLGLNQVSGTSSVLLARELSQELESIDAQKVRDEERLQYYLQQHAQHASFNNSRGLLPMVRLVKEGY